MVRIFGEEHSGAELVKSGSGEMERGEAWKDRKGREVSAFIDVVLMSLSSIMFFTISAFRVNVVQSFASQLEECYKYSTNEMWPLA